MRICDKGASNLAYGIVFQAAADRHNARLTLMRRMERAKHPDRLKPCTASETLEETERFFRSRWFRMMCDLDGEELIRMLNERDPIKRFFRD